MTQKKKISKTAKKKSNFNGIRSKLLKCLLISLFSFLSLVVGFYYIIAWGWIGDVPTEKNLRAIQNYTASEVYSSDGVLLGKYFLEDRTNVQFSEISTHMINALIATEDARFYEHQGVDKLGLLRVLFKSILLGNENAGGGSTLSQQLVKNIYPRKKYWILSMPINKIKEVISAQRLESIFSKKEILTLYLNTVPFGENAFGVESAAKRYFNTKAKKLTLEQAALLVGMLKATNTYNPRRNPDKALGRRNIVLQQMCKYQYINEKELKIAKQKALKLDFQAVSHSDGLAPYFREFLRLELITWLDEHPKTDGTRYNLYTDGLKIYTTINSKMQKYAEEAVLEQMRTLQGKFNQHWNNQKPWGKGTNIFKAALQRTEIYKRLKAEGKSDSKINQLLSEKKEMTVFDYQAFKTRQMSTLDSIAYYLQFLHTGFMVLEPQNANIKAWVGGINHKFFQYDHVNKQTKRQVGSTFKPIVYAAAIQSGISPCEHFANEKMMYKDYNNWSPNNADNQYGGYYSMRGALTHSINTISAQLIIRAGIPQVISLAKSMGIESSLESIPSLALGSADISLWEMAAAYAVFANRGMYQSPEYLIRIKNNKGEIIYQSSSQKKKKRVLSEENNNIMLHLMQNVINEGTAQRLRSEYQLHAAIAGKTGTSQAQADGWFIAFTPRLLAGAWVGAEDRRIHFRTTALGQGANTALPIWAKFFAKLSRDKSLNHYLYGSFPSLSEQETESVNCLDYIPPKDSLNLFQKIFGPKPNTHKEELPPSVKEKSPKYQDTWTKIRNMFRRKKE